MINNNRWRNFVQQLNMRNWISWLAGRFRKERQDILQERALDRRDFTPFAARNKHHEQCRDRRIAIGIKSDSFQTNCGERPGPNTDRLFYYSWRDHLLHDSRRYVELYFGRIALNTAKVPIMSISLGEFLLSAAVKRKFGVWATSFCFVI